MKIAINTDKCIGSGNCVFTAPDVFDQDEEGRAVVLDASAQPASTVVFAAAGCPVGAITIVEK